MKSMAMPVMSDPDKAPLDGGVDGEHAEADVVDQLAEVVAVDGLGAVVFRTEAVVVAK
jgi:hypothetical protein